ncbi:MAG: hypothetical protein IID41_17620, partial [Planctomycetes bacterium]|nr:hypothetical protein [Planctomycetota bacterium]
GNMLVRGDLQIGDDQSISAAGEVTIGPGGIYHADPAAKEPITATLEAGDITVLGGVVVGQLDGALVLSGSMEVTAHGDLHLNGSGIQDNDDCDDRDKGDGTPPDFNSTGNARVTVMNDFVITGSACVDQSSAEPLLLGGDFENHSIVPGIFNWAGELRMDGFAQTIEAAGEDRGPWPIGLEDNFAFGTLHLEAGTIVAVGDTFDNQQDGVIACDEALYVDTLIVSAGAVLLTDGCRVYYNELLGDGAVPSLGVDVLQILEPCPADFDGDGETGAFDLAQLLGGWGPCPSPCEPEGDPAMCPESCTPEDHAQICPADLDGDCKVAAFDLAILLGSWGSCSGQPG